MKQLLLLFSLVLLGFNANAQKKKWDIVVPEKPSKLLKATPEGKITNWGVQVLLPDSIKGRIARECKTPILLKITDTNGKTSHPDLQRGQQLGSNYTSSGLPDVHGHGTHVAGICVARGFGLLDTLNVLGVVRWKPVKVLNDQGSGDFAWIANAFNTERREDSLFLKSGGGVVYSMSFGGGTAKITSVENALKQSSALGVYFATANGNTGTLGVQYPGNSNYVLGCASLDNTLTRSSYSSYGPETWNAMPGRDIQSTYLNNGYAIMSGTSMATPFLASAICIAKSKWGNKLNDLTTLRKYFAWVASDILPVGKDDYTGYGIAFVKGILDKDPSKAPDLPTPPPPDPGPVHPPTRAPRNIYFSLTGPWKILWGASSSSAPTTVSTVLEPAANAWLTVTKIEGSTNSKYAESITSDSTFDRINQFFVNRGLMLLPNSDEYDALDWTAYFLDLICTTQYKWNLDITRIEAIDPRGRIMYFSTPNVRRYPENRPRGASKK